MSITSISANKCAVTPHRFRWGSTLALLVALGGCTASPRSAPATSPREVTASEPETHADDCPMSELETATREIAQGRLWSAKRRLERCSGSAEAELALAETETTLGDWRAARARASQLSAVEPGRMKQLRDRIAEQSARGNAVAGDRAVANQKLKEAEHLLELDDPEQGGAWAEAVYFAAAPQPEAALLAARAAALRGDTPSANQWFARATFELREAHGELSWLPVTVSAYDQCARFDDDGTLTIRREHDAKAEREFRSDQVGEDWAYHLRNVERSRTSHPGQWWDEAGTHFERVDEELVATRAGTSGVAWRLPIDDRAEVVELVPALGSQGLVELGRMHDDCVTRWRRIDLASGQATPYRFVPHVCQPTLRFAAPEAEWFVFETPSADWRSTALHVVERNGRTKSWPTNSWPGENFLIQWSDQELLVADAAYLWAVNVWTSQHRRIADVPAAVGRVTEAARDGDGVVYLRGASGNGHLEQPQGGGAYVVPLEPAALRQLRIDDWSPGAERVVGRSRAEPWRVEIWNLKRREREFSLNTVSDNARASVDATGRYLALTHHATAARVDLARGDWAFTRVPGQSRQHQPAFVDHGVVLAPAMWWWSNDGSIHERQELGTNTHGRWLAAGPWLARAAERDLWLARSPEHTPSVDVEVKRYVALSPRGDHAAVAFLDEQHQLRAGILALTPAPPRAALIWSREAKQTRAVFSRDGRHAYVSTEEGWFDISLPRGGSRRIDAPWPSVPLELSADGRRALLPTGVATGSEGPVVPMEGLAELGDGEPSPLVGFALDDAMVVGAVKREIMLWRTRDGTLLGRLLPVGRGWAFAPEGMGATGTGPIELFGDVDEPALLCAVEDRVYPWAVCADYFEQPGAFARTLRQAEQ